jgi:hypothetical protein
MLGQKSSLRVQIINMTFYDDPNNRSDSINLLEDTILKMCSSIQLKIKNNHPGRKLWSSGTGNIVCLCKSQHLMLA